jgi:hypothetical protein
MHRLERQNDNSQSLPDGVRANKSLRDSPFLRLLLAEAEIFKRSTFHLYQIIQTKQKKQLNGYRNYYRRKFGSGIRDSKMDREEFELDRSSGV